ncbi:MAG: hypothetical protein AAF620_06255 [Bacteroidota bacterium]
MRGFNSLTGNSSNNKWAIGIGRIDLKRMTITPIEDQPIIDGYKNMGFAADPFFIKHENKEYVFFEWWNTNLEKGEILVAEFKNNFESTIRRALVEPFHLSYPNVFKHRNSFYMLPEAWESGFLLLYKAKKFPFIWEKATPLLNIDYADPQIMLLNGIWYLFITTDPLTNSSMSIYYSEFLDGPWKPHRQNPIIEKNYIAARSAGRIFTFNNKLIRFSQDCSRIYGEKIHAWKINCINPQKYHEEYISTLAVQKKGWNDTAVHHVDILERRGEFFALFDGY